jgi:carboxyl-terminal processing protease
MRTTISIVTGLIAGVLIGMHWPHPQPSVASSAALLREPADEAMRLDDIVERIASDYVEELDRDALMQAAIEGVLARLDRYSAYLQPDELADLQASALGAYPGIGVELLAQRGRVTVVRARRAT